MVDFVMADDKRVSVDEVDKNWTYFEIEQREPFPEVRLGDEYKRILVFGSFSEINSEILFTGMLELHPEFRRRGIGQDFQANLAKIAQSLGYKFICGYQNDADTAVFFLENGRYLLEEVKEELQPEFEGLVDQDRDREVFRTIKILNLADVAKYIKPSRIGKSTTEKIDYKSKILAFEDLLTILNEKIKEVSMNQSKPGDPATVVEIAQDLNELLENEKSDFSKLSSDDSDFAKKAHEALLFLEAKKDKLLEKIRLSALIDYRKTLES